MSRLGSTQMLYFTNRSYAVTTEELLLAKWRILSPDQQQEALRPSILQAIETVIPPTVRTTVMMIIFSAYHYEYC